MQVHTHVHTFYTHSTCIPVQVDPWLISHKYVHACAFVFILISIQSSEDKENDTDTVTQNYLIFTKKDMWCVAFSHSIYVKHNTVDENFNTLLQK